MSQYRDVLRESVYDFLYQNREHMNNLILTCWAVNDSGYELIRRGGQSVIREQTPGPHSAVNLDAEWVFQPFSEVETDEQAISFASRYGLLGLPVSSVEPLSFTHVPTAFEYFGSRSRRRRHSEPVANWLHEALLVRQAIRQWERVQLLRDGKAPKTREEAVDRLVNGALLLFTVEGKKRGRPSFHLPRPLADIELDALNDSDDPFQDASRALRRAVTEKLGQLPIAPVLGASEGEGLGALAFRPVTLLAVIWMQLAQAISNIHELRRCEYCGRLIPIGWSSDYTSHGKRTNRRVCDDSCRTQLARRRRKLRDAQTE